MKSLALRAGLGAALALFGFSLVGHTSPPLDGTVNFTVSPAGVAAPGESITLTVEGNPGDYALFLTDTQLGNTQLPYLGGVDIGLAQGPRFSSLFRMIDVSGRASVSCNVGCSGAGLFGTRFFVQGATLDRNTGEVCVSVVNVTGWEDDGSCVP